MVRHSQTDTIELQREEQLQDTCAESKQEYVTWHSRLQQVMRRTPTGNNYSLLNMYKNSRFRHLHRVNPEYSSSHQPESLSDSCMSVFSEKTFIKRSLKPYIYWHLHDIYLCTSVDPKGKENTVKEQMATQTRITIRCFLVTVWRPEGFCDWTALLQQKTHPVQTNV